MICTIDWAEPIAENVSVVGSDQLMWGTAFQPGLHTNRKYLMLFDEGTKPV